jgi:DNA-directed RNA polymerase III subunit RPC3
MAMIQVSEGMLTMTEEKTTFSIRYHADKAHQLLSNLAVASYIHDRFGVASHRLWRCLVKKGVVEEKHLSKIALIDLRETRERLLQLFAHGLIELQDVPRSADHNPQRTIYLWKYSASVASALLKKLLLKGYANLLERFNLETSSNVLFLEQ